MLAKATNEEQQKQLSEIYHALSKEAEQSDCDYGLLEQELHKYLRLADEKLAASRRIEAYHAMNDQNKLASLRARRNRREEPLIMLVEDDRFTTAYTISILNKRYSVIHAASGEDAIIDYIHKAPDVVLIDLHLPGISGQQTLSALSAIDTHVSAVMLSVNTSQENVLSATKQGALTFLKKPFSQERLIKTIQKSPHIRRHETRITETVKA